MEFNSGFKGLTTCNFLAHWS